MSFYADLQAHLLADATIAGLVGERIHPGVRPEGVTTLPAITYFVVIDDAATSLGGFTSGLSNVRVQIDCWSRTYRDAAALALAVRNRMYVPAATFKASRSDGQDLYEDDTRLFRRSLDFSVWFTEP